MRCLVCGKEVGFARRLFDRNHCCDRHRKTAGKLSARAIRDRNDSDELEEPWLITTGLRDEKRRSSNSGISPASGLLLAVLTIVVVLVIPSSDKAAPASRAKSRPFSLPETIQKLLPGSPSFDFTENFESGLGEWIGSKEASSESWGWSRQGSQIRLGKLKLWKPTLTMNDYQMVFQGQIKEKAMGWTFRASDFDNYYATKITIANSDGNPRPEIMRWVTVDGKRADLVRLPIPLPIQKNVPYQVRLTVKADRFSTVINGQVVDTWRHGRHAKGGVGFFSDPGEEALVSWVRITDGEGLLGRLLSFSLLVTPSDLLLAGAP